MSLKIIKAGILDSIQDLGRYGYQQYGINPTGAMDILASIKANLLVGNDKHEAVIELHYPASTFKFEKPAIIALTGAEFSATLNDQFISNDIPISIPENSILRFTHPVQGARCYLSVSGGFELPKWLNSYSTHFKAAVGGLNGTKLLKDDILSFKRSHSETSIIKRPGLKNISESNVATREIMVLPGSEWNWLSEDFQYVFLNSDFIISNQSDRMGFKMSGESIYATKKTELVSSPVCFGTIQLLPDGQLIILMADHQTTGGYPRVANIIFAFHSVIAQKKPGDIIQFRLTDIVTAENLYFEKLKQLDDWIIQIN